MSSLIDFLDTSTDQKKIVLPAPLSKSVSLAVENALATSSLTKMSTDKVEEFSNKVSELATSDVVLHELSNKIGMPKEFETEEEFVNRAKSALANILKAKLSK